MAKHPHPASPSRGGGEEGLCAQTRVEPFLPLVRGRLGGGLYPPNLSTYSLIPLSKTSATFPSIPPQERRCSDQTGGWNHGTSGRSPPEWVRAVLVRYTPLPACFGETQHQLVRQIPDNPEAKSSHLLPIPRGGVASGSAPPLSNRGRRRFGTTRFRFAGTPPCHPKRPHSREWALLGGTARDSTKPRPRPWRSGS